VGVLIAAILAPAFVRYRVNRPGHAPQRPGEHMPDDDKV
jgi:hypothetical protein